MLLVILVLTTVMRAQDPASGVVLFDCGGTIQPIGGPGSPTGAARHVSTVDTTLPARVRDGCAIWRGWFDEDRGHLMLVVQTRAWAEPDGTLPTRTLRLSTPDLISLPDDGRAVARARDPDWPTLRATLDTLPGPFVASIGYVLADNRSVLLQEVQSAPARPRPRVVPRTQRRAGVVALAKHEPAATGRFAVVDAVTGTQRGGIVSALTEGGELRVVCATPDGRLYLAVARDALLVLDVVHPERRVLVPGLEVDLYWTACAAR